ncbi:MAG TPA: hypothetical protein PLU72_03100 [Candidatus Ozemobacteraceae bacterium]|nr:hypothetical protein [Candidatus Ozemobacteraceae bacterium]
MSLRYNPHRIARDAFRWSPTSRSEGSFRADVRQRALQVWSGRECWLPVDVMPVSDVLELAAEYGYDAICIASLTAGDALPGEPLLESAHRWLSMVYECSEAAVATAQKGPERCDWDAAPWLSAAFAARDHLVLRAHAYPALAAVRKAWKRAPAGPAVPGEGLRLIWSLLLPFAPLLARSFLERTGGWPAPSLEKLAEPFLPRRAVRVALERGGWNWVVVDARRFETEPGREIAGIGWIAEALGDRPWTVRSEVEGWRVCLSRTPTTAANS